MLFCAKKVGKWQFFQNLKLFLLFCVRSNMGFDLPLVAFFFKYNFDMEFTSTSKNEQLNKNHKQLILGLTNFLPELKRLLYYVRKNTKKAWYWCFKYISNDNLVNNYKFFSKKVCNLIVITALKWITNKLVSKISYLVRKRGWSPLEVGKLPVCAVVLTGIIARKGGGPFESPNITS